MDGARCNGLTVAMERQFWHIKSAIVVKLFNTRWRNNNDSILEYSSFKD